ncbi:MAG: efflux RND transporter permease subunit [Armatimonadota bacterium]|nr:MAG: efflux RND transporter permease subunit [Armatimonadota bacterium]
MIERIIDFCARNQVIVLLVVVFAIGWGVWAILHVPLDAIPDLSDVQVIILTKWMGRSPDLVEDQITYPIVTSLLGAPRVKVVRGQSFFGLSFVYVIFEDGTDMYWARSRVLEYMSEVQGSLPEGATPTLGPDATGVGWVYQYVLVEKPLCPVDGKVTSRQSDFEQEHEGKRFFFDSHECAAAFAADPERYADNPTRAESKLNLGELRSFQDWYLKYWLESVPGVSEVASVGGFEKQYQVTMDPNKLSAYGVPLKHVIMAIRESNNDVGGRTLEFSGREYFVRGRGYITSLADLEMIPLGTDGRGTPILLRDVATIQEGPDIRRGIADLDGEGEVVGGIVVMRYGENALNVINRVKEKIAEIGPALPEGIEILPVYDRSDLIERSIGTLRKTLLEESIIVSAIIVLFLLHLPSAAVAVIILPIAVVVSFIPMYYMGLTSNIMSLGGIAIAVGVMVDAAVVLIENAHKHLERLRPGDSRLEAIIDASKQVGKPLFFSLLIITVSFMPIFTLEAQEGRLFKPLAYTKTFSMLFAAFLSITLAPMLMVAFIRGRVRHEDQHPVSIRLQRLYRPWMTALMRRRAVSITIAVLAVGSCGFIMHRIGSEFMPELNEGDILYMPVTVPGISTTEAGKLLQLQDKIFRSFPEVERVFGKIGRAETATDPAPLSMVETTVMMKPQSEWRAGMTWEKLLRQMQHELYLPGVTKGGLQWPIKTRIDMLTTGIRSPVGIKVFGPDLETIEGIGEHIETTLRGVPGTEDVYAERVTGGSFVDIVPRRADAARYGLGVEDVLALVQTAIGGMNIDQTVEARERYSINVRYAPELRDDVDELMRVLVATPSGAQVPMGQLADIRLTTGPPVIRDENGALTGWVFVYVRDRDMGSYVADAQKAVAGEVTLPPGYYLQWTGQYEYMERMRKRLMLVVPLTLFVIIIMLYLNFRSLGQTAIVMLSLPFAATGSLWALYLLGYNYSAAVWVGIIALAGLAAETGVVMIVYLDEAFHRYQREGRMHNMEDLFAAITDGAVQRVRPKIMTVTTTLIGLLPLMWIHGSGADVMRRIAAPMIGGLITSTILTLEIVPAIYSFWRQRQLPRGRTNETANERR